MSIQGRPDEARSIETIHAALDAGMTLIDTADAYSLGGNDTGHGERLVAKALASWGGDQTPCWWPPRVATPAPVMAVGA